MEKIFDKKELRERIHAKEQEMDKNLGHLVRIPSIAGEGTEKEPYGKACKEALLAMKNIGERLGFETEEHEGRLLSILFGSGEKEVGIWGHLDVVPAGEGWSYPPFECTRKQGFFIGRGTQDNKGPSVAVLYAMLFLKEKGYQPLVRFRQILGCCEEKGMEDAEYYLKHYGAPDFSLVSDCRFPVCCGEKGILNLTICSGKVPAALKECYGGAASNAVPAAAGAVVGNMCFRSQGISGHAAFPEGTKSALGLLVKKLSCVDGLAEEPALKLVEILGDDGYGIGAGIACQDAESGRLTCNLGTLLLKNGCLEGQVDIRYPVTVNAEEILEKFEEFLNRYGYVIKEKKNSAPYYFSPEEPVVQSLMDIYREVTGEQEAQPYTMGGGTYARKLPRTVGFGPGMPADFSDLDLPKGHGNGHGADEAQSIKNLQKAIEIYVYALLNLSNYYGDQEEIQGKEKAERAE